MVDSSTARVCLASREPLIPLPTRTSARMRNTLRNTSSTSINISLSPRLFLVHFHNLLEHALREENPGNAEPFEELGTDLSRLEGANHLTIWPDPLLLKAEDLVHADHVLLHTRDLGDTDNFART